MLLTEHLFPLGTTSLQMRADMIRHSAVVDLLSPFLSLSDLKLSRTSGTREKRTAAYIAIHQTILSHYDGVTIKIIGRWAISKISGRLAFSVIVMMPFM
jgi:hypothetical protein